MVKILIDLTPLYARKITGVEIYGIEFYEALKKTGYEIYPVFRIKNTLDDNPNSIIIDFKSRLIAENYSLPRILEKLKPSIAFFPIFPPPINVYGIKGVKIVPTIHDMAFRYYYSTLSLKARLYLIPKYNKALKASYSIITISNCVLREIKKETQISVYNWGNNISTLYQLYDFPFKDIILKKYDLNKGEYLISVSTREPRKNMEYLFRVWKIIHRHYPQMKLVLVGRNGWGNSYNSSSWIEELKASIVFTEYIELDDLINLYHFSKAFILLSLYEGFGRTPLEALACGTKVIISDIPIFRENLKERGCYVTLNDSQEAASQILSYMEMNIKTLSLDEKWFNLIERNVVANINQLL